MRLQFPKVPFEGPHHYIQLSQANHRGHDYRQQDALGTEKEREVTPRVPRAAARAGERVCCSGLAGTEWAMSGLRGRGLTHRRGLREDVLAAQVGAGEGGRHGDEEVKYGDDNGFNRANWREGGKTMVLLGQARGVGLGTSCNPAHGACLQRLSWATGTLEGSCALCLRNMYKNNHQAAPVLEERFCAFNPSGELRGEGRAV